MARSEGSGRTLGNEATKRQALKGRKIGRRGVPSDLPPFQGLVASVSFTQGSSPACGRLVTLGYVACRPYGAHSVHTFPWRSGQPTSRNKPPGPTARTPARRRARGTPGTP